MWEEFLAYLYIIFPSKYLHYFRHCVLGITCISTFTKKWKRCIQGMYHQYDDENFIVEMFKLF